MELRDTPSKVVANMHNRDEQPKADQKNTSRALNPKILSISNLLSYIDLLEAHRKKCQNSKDFIEAEAVKMKIAELKTEVVYKKRKELEDKHLEERDEIEYSHTIDLQNFNKFWDKKLTEFESEAQSVHDQMSQKHNEEIKRTEEDMNANGPLKPRSTSEMLNFQKIIEHLAKQGEYSEAHRVKTELQQLEEKELNLAKEAKRQKIVLVINQLQQKQGHELAALDKSIEAGRLELLKTQAIESQKLTHKFTNIKKEVELLHQLENSKFEMSYRNYIPQTMISINSIQKNGIKTRNSSIHNYGSFAGSSNYESNAKSKYSSSKRSKTNEKARSQK